MKKIKLLIKNILSQIDFLVSLLLALSCKYRAIEKSAVLIPAAEINGGFGEDVMVAGFINICPMPVTVCARRIMPRSYLQNSKVKCVEFHQKKFIYCSLMKVLKSHTDLYIIGADILDGVYGNNVIRFNILKIAHILGIHCHITGFSVREQSSDYFKKKIREVSTYTKILSRDVSSYSRLKMLCDNVIQTSDIAFLCPSPNMYECDKDVVEWVETKRNKGNKIIAYCPNTIQADKIGLKTYLNNQRILLESFTKMNCSILFLYHDLRKYVLNMSDKELSKMLSDYFADKGMFVDDITDGFQLKAYLRLADFTVTGRMHFGISGYTIGLPMFGLSYYGKFEGLQALFGIGANCSLLDYDKVIDNLDIVNRFLLNFDDISKHTIENLPIVIKKAELNMV